MIKVKMRFTKSVVKIFTTTIENNVFLWVLLRNSFGGALCDCECHMAL